MLGCGQGSKSSVRLSGETKPVATLKIRGMELNSETWAAQVTANCQSKVMVTVANLLQLQELK